MIGYKGATTLLSTDPFPMAKQRPSDLKNLTEKVETYLDFHGRVVAEFERSLGNARHFLELATVSLEQEAETTVVMLEQIRDIDISGHLAAQFEEFKEMTEMLPGKTRPGFPDSRASDLSALGRQYEQLLEEAEQQRETLDRLLFTIQNPH